MAARQTTTVVATPETQKSVKDLKTHTRGFFPEPHQKPFLIVFTVAMLLRSLRVALAGFMEKRQYDRDFHDIIPLATPSFYMALYTVVGSIGFAEVMCAYYHYRFYSKVTYYVGYSVVCVAWLVDLVCLAWSGKVIEYGATIGSSSLDGSTIALCAFNIIQAVFELVVLIIQFRTYPTDDLAFDHAMHGIKTWIHGILDIANFLCRVIRVGLAAKVLNYIINDDPESVNLNEASSLLMIFTIVSGLGLTSQVSGFNYFFKMSRPNFYLHCGWLLWAFCLDVICLGFAGRQYKDDTFSGASLNQYANGVGAFTVIQLGCSVFHMAAVSFFEPDAVTPRPKLKDAKIASGVLKPFLFFTAVDVIIRIVRMALSADLFQKLLNHDTIDGISVTCTLEVMIFALFSTSGFSTAWTGYFYAFYYSQAAFFVHLAFLSMTWWFDVAGGIFALGQYSAVTNNSVNDQAQALGAGNILQCFILAILFLVVFCNKPPTDELSEAQRHASVTNDVDPRILADAKKKDGAASPAAAAHSPAPAASHNDHGGHDDHGGHH